MKIIFATVPSINDLLTECGIEDRLMSYYIIRDLPADYLKTVVETGHSPKSTRKIKRKHNWDSASYRLKRKKGLIKRILQLQQETEEDENEPSAVSPCP